jgi:hypothetical protein
MLTKPQGTKRFLLGERGSSSADNRLAGSVA